MRIRSIHPEFWRSEDIASLDWETRLVFIGLWSYVDDNGVGRDVEKLIQGDLFALEDDPREALATISRGLARLSEGGQISRYEVEGKQYLHITNWLKWQKIDKPGKARYPSLTRTDAVIRDTLSTPSREPIEISPPGEGEKGRRGEGEKLTRSPKLASEPDGFAKFWEIYPRKIGKGQAIKAFAAALRKTNGVDQPIIEGLRRQLPILARSEPQFIPHPATWLNGERWSDEQAPAQQRSSLPYASEIEQPPDNLSPAEYADWHRAMVARRNE